MANLDLLLNGQVLPGVVLPVAGSEERIGTLTVLADGGHRFDHQRLRRRITLTATELSEADYLIWRALGRVVAAQSFQNEFGEVIVVMPDGPLEAEIIRMDGLQRATYRVSLTLLEI